MRSEAVAQPLCQTPTRTGGITATSHTRRGEHRSDCLAAMVRRVHLEDMEVWRDEKYAVIDHSSKMLYEVAVNIR